jgi:protein gp37
VFCASLADICDDHPSIIPQWRLDLAALVEQTPNLIWMFLSKRPNRYGDLIIPLLSGGALNRCWFGATVENDSVASRIDDLRQIPVKPRFLSIEPLLGPLPSLDLREIHWVIVGGESGPQARPMSPDWARGVRDHCVAAGVPFFFKQWGGVRKKQNGRVLDGQLWDEFPRAMILG